MGRLQIMEVVLMNADGFLQLFDILCPTFSESCLRLAVALLAFL
jgi:hypothetical protein